MHPKLETPTCDDSLIRQTWLSVYQLYMMTTADELGLFPFLEQSPATIEEIAAKFSLNARGAEALVASLAAIGLLTRQQGVFHLTDASRNFLIPTKPFYWGHLLRMFRKFPLNHDSIMEALRGEEATEVIDGTSLTDGWEAADIPMERAITITRAMHSHSIAPAVGLAQHADLSGVRRLLDVAGGSGCYAIAMAQRHPEMRCTVADLPSVCKVAKQYIDEQGVQDRVDLLELDMFRAAWPSGYDAIFFSNILHDWDKARRAFLIRRSFEALPPGGRILIHEMLLSDSQDGPLTAALFSVNMVFVSEGKQFTADELGTLLRENGFEDVTAKPMYAGYSLVSARKPR